MVNTFRVNKNGSIDTFAGGIIACLAWKGIIDPYSSEVTLSKEERDIARQALGVKEIIIDGKHTGSICLKPKHWTAYDSQENVLGQYPTEAAAIAAVERADGERTADEILAAFSHE